MRNADDHDDFLYELVIRVTRDAPKDWLCLWQALLPTVTPLLHKTSLLGTLALDPFERENVLQEIAAAVWERIDRFVAFRAANPGVRVVSWLTTVAKRVAIDYRRRHPRYRRDRRAKPVALRSEMVVGNDALLCQVADTNAVLNGAWLGSWQWAEAFSMRKWAHENLSDEQYRALIEWLHGDVSTQSSLVRSAIARMRRRFTVHA